MPMNKQPQQVGGYSPTDATATNPGTGVLDCAIRDVEDKANSAMRMLADVIMVAARFGKTTGEQFTSLAAVMRSQANNSQQYLKGFTSADGKPLTKDERLARDLSAPAKRQEIIIRQPASQPNQGGKSNAAGVGSKDVVAMGVTSAATGLMDLFFSRLLLTIAPLTSFAVILNSGASGFRVLMSAVNVLAATFAPVLTPVIVVVSAALLALSEFVWSKLLPILDQWYKWIATTAVEAVQLFVDGLESAVSALSNFADDAGEVWEDAGDAFTIIMARLGDFADRIMGGIGGREQVVLGDIAAARKGWALIAGGNPANANNANGGNAAGAQMNDGNANGNVPKEQPAVPPAEKKNKGFDWIAEFKNGLKVAVTEFKFQNGPRASFESLSGASRSAQLAALGQSPTEAIVRKRLEQVVEKLDRMIDGIDRGNRNMGLGD